MFRIWINRIEVIRLLLKMLIKSLMVMIQNGIMLIQVIEMTKSIRKDILDILFEIQKKKRRKFIRKLLK